jgi:hypothetical protein
LCAWPDLQKTTATIGFIFWALAKDGISALGISPLALGWSTYKCNVENAHIPEIAHIIDSSLVVDSRDGVTDEYSSPLATKQVNVAGNYITFYLIELLLR